MHIQDEFWEDGKEQKTISLGVQLVYLAQPIWNLKAPGGVVCRRQDTSCVNTISRLISGCDSLSFPLLCRGARFLGMGKSLQMPHLCHSLHTWVTSRVLVKTCHGGEGSLILSVCRICHGICFAQWHKTSLEKDLDMPWIGTIKICHDASVRDICGTKTPAKHHW